MVECQQSSTRQLAARLAQMAAGMAAQPRPATDPTRELTAGQAHDISLKDQVGVLDLGVEGGDVGPVDLVALGNLQGRGMARAGWAG